MIDLVSRRGRVVWENRRKKSNNERWDGGSGGIDNRNEGRRLSVTTAYDGVWEVVLESRRERVGTVRRGRKGEGDSQERWGCSGVGG